MNLSKVEHSLIGNIGSSKGISGGERRRLSFASEVSIMLSNLFIFWYIKLIEKNIKLFIE